MSPTLRKALRVTLLVALIGAVGYFFVTTLMSNWERVSQYDFSVTPLTLGSIAFFAGAVVLAGFNWHRIMVALGETHISRWSAVESHLGSWIVRYIPSVAQPLFKVNWAAKHGVRKSTAFLAFLYEFALMQTASIAGSLIVIVVARSEFFSDAELVFATVALVALTAAGLLALRYLVNPVAKRVAKLRRIDEFESLPTMSFGSVLSLTASFTVPRFVNGIGVAMIAVTMIPSWTIFDLFVWAAAYTIASMIGIWWVFVPSGIGVREAAFVAILSAFGMNVVDGIAISIVVRLVSTVSDLVVAAIYGGMTLRSKRRSA